VDRELSLLYLSRGRKLEDAPFKEKLYAILE